jgi:hypothetical protein
MTNALTATNGSQVAQFGEMSVEAVVDRKRKLQKVLQDVMIEGEHYGKISGCVYKPTLFKSGAEVIAVTFGLAPRFVIEKTDLPGAHREYQVTCTLRHIASGLDVGEGVGAATTMESKHRWRGAGRKCPECGVAAIMRSKFEGGGWYCFDKKGGCGFKWKAGDPAIEGQEAGRIENPDPADLYNTVLKMAKKRAQVDATLTAVGASDILTQDLEDLDERHPDAEDAEVVGESRAAPQPRGNGGAAPGNAKPWIADLAACRSLDDVRAVAGKINAMPKGSPQRAEAMEAYRARKAELEGQADGGYQFDPGAAQG